MKPWSDEELALVAKWFKEGVPDDVIADRLGRTRNSVVVKRKKSGITGDRRSRRISTQARKRMSDARKSLSPERQPSWKGGRRITPSGYVEVLMPDHHRARANGYVFEHILVAEQKYGRKITRNEHVHHKDHNKQNNHPDNLEVLSPEEHNKKHVRKRTGKYVKCVVCQNKFYRKPSQAEKAKCCSLRCVGLYTAKLLREKGKYAQ